ncbi:hypothetical protein FRC02_002191 [Tulasnella sp. 418]|nr:hypothetical protein FRC02_002191 [Tulasnella sp. 418]
MKALTRVAKVCFRVHIAAKNGFPDSTESASIARKIFKEVCDERNAVEEQELFEEDKHIAKSIIKILMQCRSNLRSELKKIAQGALSSEFKISFQMGQLELADRVAKLKHKNSYIYLDPNSSPGGVYRHPAIRAIISQQWFAKQNSETDELISQFDTMPLPIIALACTAIYAALWDWEQGKFLPKLNPFEDQKYSDTYHAHLATLEAVKSKGEQMMT